MALIAVLVRACSQAMLAVICLQRCVALVDREERSFNQTLREQQDEAYRESLRADQEKVFVFRFICGVLCFIDEVPAWLSVWSEVQMICIWSS